jgi:hypothetical protein
MFEHETRVLVILPQELVDHARVFAGRATTSLKLPVSLQIVLRALIEEGLKQPERRTLLANVARQAVTVRRIRSLARRQGGSPITERTAASGRRATSSKRRSSSRESSE